jgi:hypothetical protein
MSFNTHNLIVEGINCAKASASINYLHVYDTEIVAEQKLVWRVAFLLAPLASFFIEVTERRSGGNDLC